jgi:ABC-type phosphate/phosphonate transport system permease subunit
MRSIFAIGATPIALRQLNTTSNNYLQEIKNRVLNIVSLFPAYAVKTFFLAIKGRLAITEALRISIDYEHRYLYF